MNKEKIENKLTALKTEIEQTKQLIAEYTGQEKEIYKRLAEYNINSIEQAEKEIEKLTNEINDLETIIETDYNELMRLYGSISA